MPPQHVHNPLLPSSQHSCAALRDVAAVSQDIKGCAMHGTQQSVLARNISLLSTDSVCHCSVTWAL